MSEQIRERIDNASNKDELESIGRELEPAIELDRRKNMDVLRAELHAHQDEHGEPASPDAGQDPAQTDPQSQDQAQDPEESQTPAQPQEPAPSTGGRPKNYKGRLLQNMKTGACFPWTAQLAAKRNMREV